MKFTFNSTSLDKMGKPVVPVYLTEEKNTRLVEKANGQLCLYLGMGNKKVDIDLRKFIIVIRKIVQTAKQHQIKKIAVQFDRMLFPKLKKLEDEEICSHIAQNLEMANFEFTTFKKKPKDGWYDIEEAIICGKSTQKIKEAFIKGKIIGQEVNSSRALSNTPGGDMTPTMLADEAKKASKGTVIRVSVLGKREMRKLKMGAILGVAKGSVEEPKFIIMEYWGKGKYKSSSSASADRISKNRCAHGPDKNNPVVSRTADQDDPIVLVGKGVTFDTGGLNIKTGDSISEMYMDMSGGAAVIHAITIAAKLGLKKNIIALIPAVENMPSGSSYRPGDILRSMSGKTIEVLNTDAEGRIILADALTYAKRYNPRLVVDVATLTGAVLAALGQHASAILTKDEKIQKFLMEAGEEAGDYVWPLPLWDEYEEYVKGNLGDVANIPANGNTRYAGVINGAMFLYQFVKEPSTDSGQAYPWVHIDMSSRMTASPSDNLAKGSSGDPVRLLAKLVEKY